MKASELRVGNFVKDQGNKILRIDWFEEDKVCQGMMICNIPVHPMTEHFNACNAIPLTEEWLLKFGFERSNLMGFEGGWQHPQSLKYFIQEMSNAITIHLIGSESILLLTGFHYVHQLQNLYYCLCGEELKQIELSGNSRQLNPSE